MKKKPVPVEVAKRALAFTVALKAREMSAYTGLSLNFCMSLALHKMKGRTV